MNLPKITDLVKDGRKVRFVRAFDHKLWYACEDGFEFPVPFSETGAEATFLVEDKAMFFMRWIRRHLKTVEEGLAERGQEEQKS